LPEVGAIREALAATLSTVIGIQVSPWMLGNPLPPTAHIFPGPVDYHQAMQNGHSNWELTVQVLVPNVSDIGSQQQMDGFLATDGALSVKAALESERTLGGAVDTLQVVSTTGYKVFDLPSGSEALGADWTVRVFA
jgi:hypothetical protein